MDSLQMMQQMFVLHTAAVLLPIHAIAVHQDMVIPNVNTQSVSQSYQLMQQSVLNMAHAQHQTHAAAQVAGLVLNVNMQV